MTAPTPARCRCYRTALAHTSERLRRLVDLATAALFYVERPGNDADGQQWNALIRALHALFGHSTQDLEIYSLDDARKALDALLADGDA